MANESKITTQLAVDDPLVQTANFRDDANYRRYVDNQIIGCEKHLVQSVISGYLGTYPKLSGSSAAVAIGDWVCLSGEIDLIPIVTKATPSALSIALAPYGIVTAAANPSARVHVIISGAVSNSITGLSNTVDGIAIINGSARTQVATPVGTDFIVGKVLNGQLTITSSSSASGIDYPETVNALDYSGADLGAKINAADASLGSASGIIYVPKGDYTISTAITLSAKHSLHLNDGTYDNTLTGGPIVTLGANCEVKGVGSHWGVKFKEPQIDGSGVVIAFADSSARAGGLDQAGPQGIKISNIKLITRATSFSGVTATLHFGNVTDITIEDCWWAGTHGFGIQIGNFGSAGNKADGAMIRGNVFDDCGTQNVAIVNARNFSIIDNLFRRGTSVGQTFVDLEPPTSNEIVENFVISYNRFYLVGGLLNNPGAAIAVQAAKTGTLKAGRFGVISNNTIHAGDPTNTYLVLGIALQLCSDIIISDNVIKYTPNEGIGVVGSENITITGNQLTDCGTDANQSILLYGSNACFVGFNHLCTLNEAFALPGIKENSTTYFGQVSNHNIVTGNHLEFWPRATTLPVTNPNYVPKIVLVGSGSRAIGNFINGVKTDGDGVISLTELRSLPIPGTRASGNPPTVMVNGFTNGADMTAPIMFYWDASSTATDDSKTVIKPVYFETAGRWLLSPYTRQRTIEWAGIDDPSTTRSHMPVATTTTNNTTTTADTYTIPADTIVKVDVQVVAQQSDGSDVAWYHLRGSWFRDGTANATQHRAPAVIDSQVNITGTAWTAVLDLSTNDVRIRVTGDTSKTIKWKSTWQIDKVAP